VRKYWTKGEVILWQWAIDDGPVTVEEQGSIELEYAAEKADEIWAHNAEFDRTGADTKDWWRSTIPLEKWRCTAALARMHGLPGGLDKLCQIFKIPVDQAKDKRGYELIRLFCIPKKDGTFNDRRSHPREWEEFKSYGAQDVVAMRAIHRACPHWNATPRMWSFYHLDQTINDRGVAVDLKLAEGAVNATTTAQSRMGDRVLWLTEGAVERATQRNRLLAYMADEGVTLPDLTADTVERRLEDENLPIHIKELLRVRQQASKASTAKYKRVLSHHVGGRLHGLLVFCGASRTGRWAGRTIQPQNFPRPKHPQWEIDLAIRLLRAGGIELYDPDAVLGLASSCLRGVIVPATGYKLVVSDLANIEGRDMAWVAGELWKVEAFKKFDAKLGPDMYKLSYGRAFNIDPGEIGDDDPRRQIGKVMELALQYYGGVGAFCSMAETYGLRLEDLAVSAWPVIPAKVKALAAAAWLKAVKRKRTYGLEERIWVVCHSLVLMWRAAHPAICKFWEDLDVACKSAMLQPNKEFKVGAHILVDRRSNWLRIRLPSGRYLCYPAPRGDEYTSSFLGVDPYTKQWKRISTYSGKRAENIVQAIAADHLMEGLLAAEQAGYRPTLSVHDEVICEAPDTEQYSDAGLSALLVRPSIWGSGLPLAAKGFMAHRYRK
jgi:DNA polymerase bacteriophage-type